MNGGKGGVSYPPCMADAKREMPNGATGIPCRGNINRCRKEGTEPDNIRRNGRRETGRLGHLAHETSADEGIETGITLAFAG